MSCVQGGMLWRACPEFFLPSNSSGRSASSWHPQKTLRFPTKCGCSDVHIPSSEKPKHIVSSLCGLVSLLTLCLFSKGSGIPGNPGAATSVKVLQGWMLQQIFLIKRPRNGHNVQDMLSPRVEQNPPRDF